MVSDRITVAVPATHVFEVFTSELGEWWPPEYTFSGDDLAAASVEHLEGGSWFELDRSGARLDWGEVLLWQPPRRLVLTWRVGANRQQEPPERASRVELVFTPLGDSETEVTVQHSNFAKHGHGAETMRQGMASEHGWQRILQALGRYAETRATDS